MAEPMSELSPEKVNSNFIPRADEDDMTFHEPPSSPFISFVDDDQENIAPTVAPTPVKPLVDFENDIPQSAFKISSPSKTLGMKERSSPIKLSPPTQTPDDDLEESFKRSFESHTSSRRTSPVKAPLTERPESAMSNGSRRHYSPAKSSRTASVEPPHRLEDSATSDDIFSPVKHSVSPQKEFLLRDNEGLTVAMRVMEETRSESYESSTSHHSQVVTPNTDDMAMDETEFNPDGPEFTALDVDDTTFSAFSEMPTLDLTKFAALKNSPTKKGFFDQATPRAHAQMTPSTVRRTARTPSPTPRRSHKQNETTELLLDFTAQFEAFSTSHGTSPGRGRRSPVKSTTQPNLLSYMQNQRSPAKAQPHVPSTPSPNRQLMDLLDFELPPPPTPRSVPTVTIREMESLKSTFQSQISSLSASLSGKEAEVESLVKAVSNAERRVGEAHELVRDERSAREHAESQMVDWKKKGEEVQNLLHDVQTQLAHNDTEREALLSRLADAEKRAEEAEQRSLELETRAIEAESKNVDMTTFINPDEDAENKKIYSETECQTAIAEKVNEVARDLHSAYKAKHEKKIKALKENYNKKADERCKELRVQIIRLERQVEEAEKKKDDTFSRVLPTDLKAGSAHGCEKCGGKGKGVDDLKVLESQKFEIENLKAKLAGLQSELNSLRKSHDALLQDLEVERVEKGELVAAAEQMLAMCGEKMGEMQQEEMRKSHIGGGPPTAPPDMPMRNTGFLAGGPAGASARPGSAMAGGRPGSAMGDRLGAMGAEKGGSIAKPSGIRGPGGFGFQGSAAPGLSRSISGGKSRIMSNIERMGGGRTE